MVIKSIILLFLTFSSSSLCSGVHKREVSIDNAVDNLADDFNMINEANGMACRHIKDIRQSFEKKVRFVKIKGTFEATHGQFCNLSTFRRTGSATLSSTPTSITINIRLGLGQTYCYFPEYHATFGSIKVSGDVRVTAKELSTAGQLTLFLGDDDECIAVLDYIMVETVGEMNVDINGMGPIGWLGSKVVEWIINDFKSELMIRWIEKEMRTSLEKILQNRPFCQYLTYL